MKSKSNLPAKMRVYVSMKDIEGASPGEPELCPIARAVKRRLPKGYKVSVGADGFKLVDIMRGDSVVKEYSYSSNVNKMITMYDRGYGFQPRHINLSVSNED